MNHNIQYYLIHGLDKNRGKIMMDEFKKWGFDLNKITWEARNLSSDYLDLK